jgi:hypothetical protein
MGKFPNSQVLHLSTKMHDFTFFWRFFAVLAFFAVGFVIAKRRPINKVQS